MEKGKSKPVNAETSLYECLGGHEGILTLLEPFYIDVRQHGRSAGGSPACLLSKLAGEPPALLLWWAARDVTGISS